MAQARTTQARRAKPAGGTRAQQAEPGRARRRKTARKQAAAGYSRAGTGALTADLKLGELVGQLKALAPKPDKPLKGTTVPAVNLKRGSQGPGVKLLQSALVKLRYMTQAQMDTGPGIFGAKTEAALKKFQRAQGVDPLGVYGPKTRAAFAKLGATVRGGGTTPPSTHRNPYLAQFQRALTRLRLPKAWATSDALWQLVQHESSWNPRAKNPRSTAFGLFQFLRSTWAAYCREGRYGSTDPYIQALGGFRYIKARYGTPAKAWAFWRQHHWY